MSRLLTVGDLQHLRAQAGAAHAQEQGMREAGAHGIGCSFSELRQVRNLVFHHMKPAEPPVFIVPCPE